MISAELTSTTLPPKRALITGASRGIGAAIAKQLAMDGFDIVLNYASNHKAAEIVAKDIEACGRQVNLAPFNVASREDTAKAIESILSKGAIDVLVNNAGVVRDAPFPSMRFEEWDDVIRTSLDGFFHVTSPLVMPMVRKKWGRIITLSSISGIKGNRGQVNYAAAKAGLIGASKALALELAKRNITVNVVAPGLIDTDMIAEAPLAEIVPLIPMKRIGTSQEVADLVSFLASEKASYMTGQVFPISGGLL